jgi:hypothetical protein
MLKRRTKPSAPPARPWALARQVDRKNGDTRHLTITPQQADATLAGEAFVIYSEYGTPGNADFQSHMTMGLVTN